MSTHVPDTWYKNFFSGINNEMWRKAVTPEWTESEVQLLIEALKIKEGAHILDIPSGMGRHAMSLAKKGYQVTCFDISEDFLATLGQSVQEENLSIEIIHGDILSVALTGTFDGAYCLGNSFGYFDYTGMQTFIQKVAASLKPGGRFVINSGMLAESILPRIPAEKVYTLEGLTMQINNEYVVNGSYMISKLKYVKNEQTEEHSYKHFVYTAGEIKRLLALYGLSVTDMYNSVDKTPYALGDQQVYLVAEKAGSAGEAYQPQ